jgi:hypothetical protein
MTVNTTLTIKRDGDEIELEITARVNGRYIPASWTSPGEGGEIESIEARIDGELWDGQLTDDEVARAEERIHEAAEDQRRDCGGEDY